MLSNNTFEAPWSRSLKVTTFLCCLLLSIVFLFGALNNSVDSVAWEVSMKLVPLALLVITAFFSIKGYRIVENRLFIQRVGWQSTVDLTELQAIEVDPDAMRKSIRLFGNGGLFCFAGLFRNKRLGKYRAFATNPRNAVVLRFPQRTVVVTPEEPESFAEAIEATRRH